MTMNTPPPTRRRITGRVAAWTTVATFGVLAVTGVALAAPAISAATNSAPNPAPSASGSASPDKQPHSKGDRPGKGNRQAHLPRLGKNVHAQAVVRDKDGKFITVYTQRGTVTAVSATSITLKSADGFTSTYVVNAETKVAKVGGEGRKHGEAAKIGDIKVGDLAGVVAVKSAESKTARGILVGDPKQGD